MDGRRGNDMRGRVRRRGARTPLGAALRRAARIVGAARREGAPPLDEVVDLARERRWTRREILKAGAAGAALAASGPLAAACHGTRSGPGAPRIAVIGAGIAGLNAAWRLAQAGYGATIYEASDRTGGRMYTARDLLAPGLTTELGGEFIDTEHAEILALAEEFGLPLFDRQAPSETALAAGYFFGGRHYSEAEVLAAFAPLAARIQEDYDSTEDLVDYAHEGGAGALDRTSIAEYLEQIGATGFIRDLLDVAYVTEYGLDADEQSALNLIFLIGLDLAEGFQIFGTSDERYKIQGGNQRIVDELAARLDDRIALGHRLAAIRARGRGFALYFERTGGGTREVAADVVLLTLPFTLLRQVDVDVPLPAVQRRAIDELGYGTNAKVLVGLTARPWRTQGFTGECFTDAAFQLCWDSSQLQPGIAGGLTLYSGGAPGLEVGGGSAESQAARLLPGVEQAFPGVLAAQSGTVARFHWPTHPFTLASYACYRPGQWTTIAGAEGLAVGNLFFAGEHTSYDFQGYMQGGAQSGRDAAEAILARVRGRAAG